jgi:proline iminopeptidase
VILHAGRKRLVFCVQNIDHHHHQIESIPSALMASEQEISQVNRNLYPHIEPYSTGFLKVSDLHSIYWEQSGNPTGHVSSNCLPSLA